MLSADNLCKQFGPVRITKLFDTLMVFLKEFFWVQTVCKGTGLLEKQTISLLFIEHAKGYSNLNNNINEPWHVISNNVVF